MVVLLTYGLCPRKKTVSHLTSAARLACSSFLFYIVLFPLSETVLKGGYSCSGTLCSSCGMACSAILLVIILITFSKFTCSFVILSKFSSNQSNNGKVNITMMFNYKQKSEQ
jgi:hypothetical protein